MEGQEGVMTDILRERNTQLEGERGVKGGEKVVGGWGEK